jgi:hypothetical protein
LLGASTFCIRQKFSEGVYWAEGAVGGSFNIGDSQKAKQKAQEKKGYTELDAHSKVRVTPTRPKLSGNSTRQVVSMCDTKSIQGEMQDEKHSLIVRVVSSVLDKLICGHIDSPRVRTLLSPVSLPHLSMCVPLLL